jgi:hypothetical protein
LPSRREEVEDFIASASILLAEFLFPFLSVDKGWEALKKKEIPAVDKEFCRAYYYI